MIAPRRPAPLALLLIGLAGLCLSVALSVALTVQAQSQEVTPTAGATGESPPAKPTNLQASAEHDAVALTWTASTDQTVTHYAILRRNRDTDATGVFHVIESNAGPETSYTDNSVSASSRYNYRVKAVSPTGVSQWSGYVKANTLAAPDPTPTPTPTSAPTPEPESSAADQAPTGLTVALADGGGVALSWDAPAEDADSVTGYEVLRAAGDAEFSALVSDTGSTATAYTDATATQKGETYAYQVKAIRGDDRSQASNQAEIKVPHDPVDLAPTNLAAASADDGINLTWNAPFAEPDSVTGYRVLRRRPNQNEDALTVLETNTASTATTYQDTGATAAGQTYVYAVRALRDDEPSQSSDVVEIKRPETAARAPSNLTGLTSLTIGLGQVRPRHLGHSQLDRSGRGRRLRHRLRDPARPGRRGIRHAGRRNQYTGHRVHRRVAGNGRRGRQLQVPSDRAAPEGKSLPSNQWPFVESDVYVFHTLDLGMTADSLVKNTGQTAASTTLSLGSGEVRAQSFTTGANPSGYTLSSIGVGLGSATSTAATDLTAKVQENSAGEPGSDVCTLTGSAAYAAGVNAFNAPANCNLSANTTYFFVVTYSAGTFALDNTSSGDEDVGSGTNWSIGDDSLELRFRHLQLEHGKRTAF